MERESRLLQNVSSYQTVWHYILGDCSIHNGMIYCYIFWNGSIVPVLELIQEIVDESVL